MITFKDVFLFMIFLMAIQVEAAERKMLLIGGGLKICSSYSIKHCPQKLSFDETAYQSSYFQISQAAIKTIESNHYKIFSSKEKHQDVVALLVKYLKRHKSEPVNRRELIKRLDALKLTQSQRSGRDILDSLYSDEWNFVFQNLQLPVTDSHGNGLTEYVFLDQSHADSRAIITRFVKMVQQTSEQERPLILVSTASAGDVFDAASFYIQLFKGFQVDVAWLPIEASLLQVLSDENVSCNQLDEYRGKHYAVFNREKTYPQLAAYQQSFCEKPAYFEQLINRASGIFFNGGDQFLTLSALADTSNGRKLFSPTFKLIQQRFNDGKLVVAGTSAGAAVQSGGAFNSKTLPMITNGESIAGFFNGSLATNFPPSSLCESKRYCGREVKANSLTVFQPGGLGLLPIGLLDTHFSERDRAFRMIRLLADHHLTRGFGVDENTALVVTEQHDKVKFEVVGEGAVWQFDRSMSLQSSNQSVYGSTNVVAMFDKKSAPGLEQRLDDDIVAKLVKQSLKSNTLAKGSVKAGDNKANIAVKAEQTGAQLSISLEILSDD